MNRCCGRCARALVVSLFLIVSFFVIELAPISAFANENSSDFIGCVPPIDTYEDGSGGLPNSISPGKNRYARNQLDQCLPTSDANAKLDAHLTFRAGSATAASIEIERCMELHGCYRYGSGTRVTNRCLFFLCECNRLAVNEQITCGGRESGVDCQNIKDILDAGGGAVIGLRNGSNSGHAVSATRAICDFQRDICGLTIRDPNRPEGTSVLLFECSTGNLRGEAPIGLGVFDRIDGWYGLLPQ